MKDKLIDLFVGIIFFAAILFIIGCMISVFWGAYELHGIHHELQVLNDSIQW